MNHLLEHCRTKAERVAITALIEHGSPVVAAEALDRDPTGIRHHLRRVTARAQAAEAGTKQDEVTTRTVKYVDEDGSQIIERTRRTNKVDPHTRTYQAWCDAVEDYCANCIAPLRPARQVHIKKPDPNLIDKYLLTDYHLGMLACREETGNDWDTKIAREQAMAFMREGIARSSNADTALLVNLGDFLHWDSLVAETPTSRHVVDTDTRYQMLVRVALRLRADMIRMALTRYSKVFVVECEGNHDLSGSVWLREALRMLFADDPRVEFLESGVPYYAMLWGRTMLAFHHGHMKKNAKLPQLFASEPRFREMWGACQQCYIDTGHYHHEARLEDGGAIVERHPTLAGRDGYAARGGYVSNRGAFVVTYHRDYGEHSRIRIVPHEL